MADNPRKDPFVIRRASKKEFSRVSAMIMARLESLEARMAALENQGATKPRERSKSKKKPQPQSQNDNQERFEAESDKRRLEEEKKEEQ
jgi:Skp family chaperone for outer membrane proteins